MSDNNPQTEFDSPWKQILQLYFEEFMQFFFPQAHAEIDWTQQPEFLDQELQQVVRDAELPNCVRFTSHQQTKRRCSSATATENSSVSLSNYLFWC
ncbi:MAG: hypothetical protein V7L30_33615 [Nostoc sp.]|uniref:hypothetical protein n=1 Tax=Nostoc sp. TaxID=1180 RepID=UPI002FF4837A